MARTEIDSDFLQYLFAKKCKPGDRLPPLNKLSDEIGISVGKLREQLEVARMIGLVDASPRRGITSTGYNFLPAVRLSLMTALALDRGHFEQYTSLRVHLEVAYWDEAVSLLTTEDKKHLDLLVSRAKAKLNHERIRIPHPEHREFHLTIFRRLENPFVKGLLEAYWDAYEAVELHVYTDYKHLKNVWDYHEQIVDSICRGDYETGKRLLAEHVNLLVL